MSVFNKNINMAVCEHYVRKCSFVAPCCKKIYPCRFCHDAAEEDHELERKTVQQIVCCQCEKTQNVASHCTECGIKFGFYFCAICRLYDDRDKGQFHCDLCGVCRVGGKENFFHCTMCDMCYPNNIRSSHKCIEKCSRANCPICMEDMHSSPIPCQVLRCGHLLHQTCFQACLRSRLQQCPLCSTSMVWEWRCLYKQRKNSNSPPGPARDSHISHHFWAAFGYLWKYGGPLMLWLKSMLWSSTICLGCRAAYRATHSLC